MGIVIKSMDSYEDCWAFARRFYEDSELRDFRFANQWQTKYNLQRAIEKPQTRRVLGVFQDDQWLGLFVFLVFPEERYLEMTIGLSVHSAAYGEIFRYLQRNFQAYKADFVFNPNNHLLKAVLTDKGADFETEQQKMILKNPVPAVDTVGIELLSEKYIDQYLAIHNQDMYWTGEKVIAAPDRFRTFVALEKDTVVGYLDVTHCFEENEPYDFFVLEPYRRKSYGRKLLAEALKQNEPNSMMLLVDIDNHASIPLYTSMGFVKVENENCLTAHWHIPRE